MKTVVLVTGASSGLGKEIAKTLSGSGFKVYDGSKDLGQEGAVEHLLLDVTSDESVSKVVKKIIEKEGKIDVLVNNAGFTFAGPLENFSSSDFSKILDVNTLGPFRMIKAVLPYMKSKRSGKIINITSLNGLVSLPGFSLYSSSKFALEALGLAVRQELLRENIYVTNIVPGAIKNKEGTGKLPHKPAREKFLLLKLLMPMVTKIEISKKILEIIKEDQPPSRILLGNDAFLTYILYKLLPSSLWDSLLGYIWNKK